MIKDESGKEIPLAEATTIQVSFDYEKKVNISVPEKWKKRIEVFEK